MAALTASGETLHLKVEICPTRDPQRSSVNGVGDKGRHAAGGGRLGPQAFVDAVDDWMLLLFGLPIVLA
jgi:hypothetical protein